MYIMLNHLQIGLLIVGIVLALVLILFKWSRKNGSKEKDELLPYPLEQSWHQ